MANNRAVWTTLLLLSSFITQCIQAFSISYANQLRTTETRSTPLGHQHPTFFASLDNGYSTTEPRQHKRTHKAPKSKRTRRRASNPQQTYVYAAQRKKQQKELDPASGELAQKFNRTDTASQDPTWQARQLGFTQPTRQHCDPLVDTKTPLIVGRLRVGNETGSGAYAYVVDKPAGWSILGTKRKASTKTTKDDVPVDSVSEDDVLALLTPEEQEDYLRDLERNNPTVFRQVQSRRRNTEKTSSSNPTVTRNLKRIESRLEQQALNGRASFETPTRRSVVAWLKAHMSSLGTPIRGGNFWMALAGATNIDDSGLVLLCPRVHKDKPLIERAEYTAVVGNDKSLSTSRSKRKQTKMALDLMEMQVISTVRKGRIEDTCQTIQVVVSDTPSTCSSIVPAIEEKFIDGIRGDVVGNPLDCRAPRRLLHCQALVVSSLSHDDDLVVDIEDEGLPDDISLWSDRRYNVHQAFYQGSFLGRRELRANPLTNAYREINGAADGYPGWTVDRYGDWLLVQHDEKEPYGPLPSIHDGNTAGIYYLPVQADRSAMGASKVRPTHWEGQEVPTETFPVLENGVTYHVSFNDLSTGLFFDQRQQRAWIQRNCHSGTHVLNCFAHCGSFTVAAASAGASTVSIDSDKKWLDRIPPQLEANGVALDHRHDYIYGDCMEWLRKLCKRGETYDVVILDPPTTSVDKTKKKSRRWSVKKDMDELVALAAPLVKPGGVLWTISNSAEMPPTKFAELCKQGLEKAKIRRAKLERIAPMPVDFPSIGTPPVKAMVWRIP